MPPPHFEARNLLGTALPSLFEKAPCEELERKVFLATVGEQLPCWASTDWWIVFPRWISSLTQTVRLLGKQVKGLKSNFNALHQN